MRRARAKAYVIQYGKLTLTVPPLTYNAINGWRRGYAFSELRARHRLSVEPVVGNRKFTISPRAEVAAFRATLRKLEGPAKARAQKQERIEAKKFDAYRRKEAVRRRASEMKRLASERSFLSDNPLPSGILASDLMEAPYEQSASDETLGRALHGRWSSGSDSFEIWNVGRIGWVVPTLLIKDVPGYRARRRVPQGTQRRTYAVSLRDGSVCRVGMGPHVQKVLTVHLRKTTLSRLQPIIQRINEGSIKASECRDSLSTRRAGFGYRRRAPDLYSNLFLLPGGRK